MYSLFSNYKRPLGGQSLSPEFHNFSAKTYADIGRIIDHYRANEYVVKSTHLVCKLIMAMDIPPTYDLNRYYETALQRYVPICSLMGIITAANKGRWHYGEFYHECPELILGYSDNDNPIELAKIWRDLEAVKCLEHPVSNLKYMLPNGVNHNTERGLAVIGIDIPKLMVQWYMFSQEQIAKVNNGESYLGVTHFMYKYVLPNMLHSQTDLVIFNRLVNLLEGRPMGDSIRKHTFYISDYSVILDRVLEKLLDRFAHTKMRYQDLLWQIPGLYRDYPLWMPDIAPTRQAWWAMFLTRIKAMKFLLEVGGQALRQYNRKDLNDLFVSLKQLRQENVYPQFLDKEIEADTMDDIAMFTTLVRE